MKRSFLEQETFLGVSTADCNIVSAAGPRPVDLSCRRSRAKQKPNAWSGSSSYESSSARPAAELRHAVGTELAESARPKTERSSQRFHRGGLHEADQLTDGEVDGRSTT